MRKSGDCPSVRPSINFDGLPPPHLLIFLFEETAPEMVSERHKNISRPFLFCPFDPIKRIYFNAGKTMFKKGTATNSEKRVNEKENILYNNFIFGSQIESYK
ncbi:hypothetical protein niasHT_029992 [Heterodera trifolii]|uniref:Uncharacterized protein n=1 Tax=Heterodera trifolii TaxID=157864 RepID=A0ABD2JJY3_9BILA